MDNSARDRTETTAETTEYLRLRCGILDQIDRDMFGRGLAAGAACGAAEEAFAAAGHPEWVKGILLGILARRDPDALMRWADDLAEMEQWAADATMPPTVREWLNRDLRRTRRTITDLSGHTGV